MLGFDAKVSRLRLATGNTKEQHDRRVAQWNEPSLVIVRSFALVAVVVVGGKQVVEPLTHEKAHGLNSTIGA